MKPSRAIDYKKRWRAKPGNKAAEAEAHRARRTEQERLLEALRDTIRHIDTKEQA